MNAQSVSTATIVIRLSSYFHQPIGRPVARPDRIKFIACLVDVSYPVLSVYYSCDEIYSHGWYTWIVWMFAWDLTTFYIALSILRSVQTKMEWDEAIRPLILVQSPRNQRFTLCTRFKSIWKIGEEWIDASGWTSICKGSHLAWLSLIVLRFFPESSKTLSHTKRNGNNIVSNHWGGLRVKTIDTRTSEIVLPL